MDFLTDFSPLRCKGPSCSKLPLAEGDESSDCRGIKARDVLSPNTAVRGPGWNGSKPSARSSGHGGPACLLEMMVTTMMVVVHHHFATYLCMQERERELTPAPVPSAPCDELQESEVDHGKALAPAAAAMPHQSGETFVFYTF